MVQPVELCLAKNSARTSGPAYNKVTRLLRKSLILHSLVIFVGTARESPHARLGLPIRVEKELSIRHYLISFVISHLCVPLVVREFEMLSLLVKRSNAEIMGSGRCRLDALNLFGRFH